MKYLALCLALVACTNTPAVPPSAPEASVGDAAVLLDAGPNPDACGLACADYVAAGCRVLSNCADVCRKAVSDGLIHPPPRSIGVCPPGSR